MPREPLNQSSAVLSGSFAPTFRFENLEILKGFLRFPNLNLEQNSSLTALAIESELPKIWPGRSKKDSAPALFPKICCISKEPPVYAKRLYGNRPSVAVEPAFVKLYLFASLNVFRSGRFPI